VRHLVLGAGVSGTAAARLLRRHGEDVVVFDERRESLDGLGDSAVELVSGEWRIDYLEGIADVIASPGFAEHSPPIAEARAAGLDVWSELELGWRHTTAPVVAVTGTNGKTTTTQLITDMAVAGGVKAVAAGNIGTAMSDVAEGDYQLIAVEASSFQLRFIDAFAPAVAVILNIAPDHLDWHGSLEAYTAAKARIAENLAPGDPLVFDADDAGAAAVAASAPLSLAVSGRRRAQAGGVAAGSLWVGDDAIGIGSVDPAFGVDIAAAAVAATWMGVGLDAVAVAIAGFQPAPHRRRVVAEIGGVLWVDDSKATNPHAALAAAAAYDSVILIAGGRNKGLDISPLATAPTVRRLIAIGESAAELEAAAPARVTIAPSLQEAVAQAGALAQPGDTVLLAPGCASFDQFESYAARGDAFIAAIEARSR
jgi:UDP-N-acetylmuramoylalanine--D-glutamate ligase